MKRITAFCMMLLALFFSASIWGLASADEQTSPGVSIEDAAFFALGDSFFKSQFAGYVNTAKISETMTLMYNPNRGNRLLPNLLLTITEVDELELNLDTVKNNALTILQVMDALQKKFPDAPVFNLQMVGDMEESNLGYMVPDEQGIWLWSQSHNAVIVPVALFNGETGELVDGMYLLEIVISEDEHIVRCALYNDAQYVAEYMDYVSVDPDRSEFEAALQQWYLQNYLFIHWEDSVIGTVRIIKSVAYVVDNPDFTAFPVARVYQGEEYQVGQYHVGGKEECGWFLIRCADDKFGYLPETAVEFTLKSPSETE